MSKEAMKLALEALENSIDLVSKEARNAEELYGEYPTRLSRIQGLVAFEVAHEKAITALREALAEQPEPVPWSQALESVWAEHHDPIGDAQDKLIAEKAAQKRPQNCGTGYCSCIECVMEPAQQEPVAWWDAKLGVFDEKHFDQLQPLYTSPPAQRTWVGLMRGVRVEGDTVVITVKGGNDAARELCGALLEEKNT